MKKFKIVINKNIILLVSVLLIILIGSFIYIKIQENKKITENNSVIINNINFTIEIADTVAERSEGLMYRESLDKDKGMLFIYEDSQIRNFWMKNTLIPLDMIFIDENKNIVRIEHNAQPCKTESCNHYSSKTPVKYVLEINGGLSEEYEFQIGDNVNF